MGSPGLQGLGRSTPGWVAKVDPLIKQEPLPNTQLPKKGDPVTDNKELSTPEYEVVVAGALFLF